MCETPSNRGGKGLRDIRTSERNGKVIGIARVNDDDEVFMMTAKGKLQRIKAADISVIGRNTQGVRIMNVDDGDSLIAVVRVPPEEASEEELVAVAEGEASADAAGAGEAETDTGMSDANLESDAATDEDSAADEDSANE